MLKQLVNKKIYLTTYQSKECVLKERVKKSYRISEIDILINKKRTKSEIHIMETINNSNLVHSPKLLYGDIKEYKIYMEYLSNCVNLKDYIDDLIQVNKIEDIKIILKDLGFIIAEVHNLKIIHGDLTTSNFMIDKSDISKIYILDFGLSFVSESVENRAVDLYVIEKTFICSHNKISELFNILLNSYSDNITEKKKGEVIKKLDQVRMRGRKKIAFG